MTTILETYGYLGNKAYNKEQVVSIFANTHGKYWYINMIAKTSLLLFNSSVEELGLSGQIKNLGEVQWPDDYTLNSESKYVLWSLHFVLRQDIFQITVPPSTQVFK